MLESSVSVSEGGKIVCCREVNRLGPKSVLNNTAYEQEYSGVFQEILIFCKPMRLYCKVFLEIWHSVTFAW